MDDAGQARLTAGSPLTRRRMLGLTAMAVGLGAVGTAGCSAAAVARPTASGGPAALAVASATGSGGPAELQVTAPPPVGVLGANVNQNLDTVDFAELENVTSTWLRGFYLMQNADQGDVANQPGMRKLATAIQRGYGTVLNMKFDYDSGLPAPGSAAMTTALARLDTVLAVVMGKVDILVVGNEPFFECGGKTANINKFYEALAQHTIDYRQQHSGSRKNTQIYLGALTDLQNPRQSWAGQINRWMEFVKGNPAIAGTDCHPHVASLRECSMYVDYVVPRLRPDQKFLATEFSLVKLWQNHLKDPISAQFADQYHIPRGTLVWQVANDAVKHPFPQDEWNDFLLSNTWFADNKQCMSDMMAIFRKTGKCAVAGYGITQDTAASSNFGPDKTPWIFNSIFCPYTVQRGADGLPGHNTTWGNEFRSLQHA